VNQILVQIAFLRRLNLIYRMTRQMRGTTTLNSFITLKTERLDSADYYYAISQPKMEKLKDWKLYFNSVDARANTLEDRGLFKLSVQELKEGISKSIALSTTQYTAMLYPRLAYSYHDMGLYEEGVAIGKQAIDFLATTDYTKDLMSAINAVAINFDDWGKYDSALYYHYLNVDLGLEHTTANSAASTFNNIGNTYMKMDQLDSAEHYFIKSLEISKRTRRTNLLATVLTNLGDISLRKENLNQAKYFLDSAVYYAESDLMAPLEKRRDVYLVLSKYYKKKGDMSNAFNYQSQYYVYRDSMHNLEQIEEIKNLQLKAATAENEKKLAQADAQLKSRNLWIIAISGLLILTIILLRQFYLKRLQVAQEAKLKLQEERLRISRDLHDNIGAELTYISSVIDQRVFGLKDPEAKKEYEVLSTSSRNAMTQLRETIWAIKTDEITINKFRNKLNELSQKYTAGLGLTIAIRNSGEDYLIAPAKVINLFRVCQEAINNAIKHSGSSQILIDINAEDYNLNLSISDNGKGFDLAHTKTGYGLQNMRERVEEIGGTFYIASSQQSGTHIQIKMALPDSSSL
jgi:signal transduction histidine kinase